MEGEGNNNIAKTTALHYVSLDKQKKDPVKRNRKKKIKDDGQERRLENSKSNTNKLNPDALEFTPKPRKPVERPQPSPALDWKGKQDLEIAQLKIRYGSNHWRQGNTIDDGQWIAFDWPIEDPEFPFELDRLGLQITFPRGYPEEGGFPKFDLLEPIDSQIVLPQRLLLRVADSLNRAAKSLPAGALCVRPVLHYLERNLETMLVEAPTPGSTFKFVPAPAIVVSKSPITLSTSTTTTTRTEETLCNLSKSLNLHDTGGRFREPINIRIEAASSNAGAILMTCNGLTMETIGMALVVELGVALRCERCSGLTSIHDLRPYVDRLVTCTKCTKQSQVRYTMEALHGQSARIGSLRCRGTLPTDYLASSIQVTCDKCLPGDTDGANTDPLVNTLIIDKVAQGERVGFACRNCHQPCKFGFDTVTWTAIAGLLPAAAEKKLVQQRLPTQVGQPLPHSGACSHYKKSFRWFRFPCCGKAYPCDTCHDQDNPSHKVEWATRQICGLCSREFSTSKKECICGATPGEPRRTSHWEGGKGTRDQTVMSRKDRKKYRSQ